MDRRAFLAVTAVAMTSGCARLSSLSNEPEPAANYELEIDYPHPWAGETRITLDTGVETEVIEGDGPERIPLPDDGYHLEARVRKTETPEGALAVRLLKGGEVELRSSMGAGWGGTGIDVSLD